MVDLLYGSRETFPTFNESPILNCRQNRFTRSVSYSGINRYLVKQEKFIENLGHQQSNSPLSKETYGFMDKIRHFSNRFTSPTPKARNLIRFKSKSQVVTSLTLPLLFQFGCQTHSFESVKRRLFL